MWPPPDALWMYWAAKEAWLAGHVLMLIPERKLQLRKAYESGKHMAPQCYWFINMNVNEI